MVTNIRDSVHELRYALVTGAAAGIVRAVAEDLARRGYRLVLADINHDALLEFRSKLQNPVTVQTSIRITCAMQSS